MIVFNHNLIFKDRPTLQQHIDKEDLLSVIVSEKTDFSLSTTFPLTSAWVPSSGQLIRYHSHIPFEQADDTFSWALEVKGVVSLIWDGYNRRIFFIHGSGYTPERLRFWLCHTFFPLVLELSRTYHFLHVGSVEVQGRVVLFSALSFGGKSTLTDYFINQGHTMFSDDSLGIEQRESSYFAVPSYPFQRPFRQPETLGHYVDNFATSPRPIHVVFSLASAAPDAEVTITELSGIDKFKAFHFSAYVNWQGMKQERFRFFSEMAASVPMYKIIIPWDLNRLGEVYDEITAHVNCVSKVCQLFADG
jgi:hypothetical protein